MRTSISETDRKLFTSLWRLNPAELAQLKDRVKANLRAKRSVRQLVLAELFLLKADLGLRQRSALRASLRRPSRLLGRGACLMMGTLSFCQCHHLQAHTVCDPAGAYLPTRWNGHRAIDYAVTAPGCHSISWFAEEHFLIILQFILISDGQLILPRRPRTWSPPAGMAPLVISLRVSGVKRWRTPIDI